MARYSDCTLDLCERKTMSLPVIGYVCILLFLSTTAVIILRRQRFQKPPPTQPSPSPIHTATSARSKTAISIGVLTPLPNESALLLTQGLSSALRLSTHYTYSVIPFAGDNTRVTLFEHAKQALEQCNILITLGVTCANVASEAYMLSAAIPLINLGLRQTQLMRITPGHAFTIVTEYDYDAQVRLFRKLKPSARSICILYRRHSEQSAQEAAQLTAAFQRAGLTVNTHVLIHATHIDNQLSALHKTYDSLFIMPHTVTAQNLPELITYCAAKNITLCSQERDLVTLGTHLGFAEHERELGLFTGHLIRDFFEGKKNLTAGSILTHSPVYRCSINKTKYDYKNSVLTPEDSVLLEQLLLINQPTMPLTKYAPHSPIQ
jgi:ABC-type uncharacterized transport system substrate-binding protein